MLTWIKCPHSPKLRCYSNNEPTCPFRHKEFIRAVERWALKSGDLRSMDPGIAIGSLSKHRTNAGQESRALEAALMYRLFEDPDAVLEWLQSGSVRRASMPMAVCEDLKRGARRWKSSREEVQDVPDLGVDQELGKLSRVA